MKTLRIESLYLSITLILFSIIIFSNSLFGQASQYPAGSIFCVAGPTMIVNVTNPLTGKVWMDRNLGATQAATSSTDSSAYGDLYQWGRRADGHQCRNSGVTSVLSSTDQLAHGRFILASNSPYDWRRPQNGNLWQGVNGVNNPCPHGYRLPLISELEAENLSWSSNDAAGAFDSPLKLPLAGIRSFYTRVLTHVGREGQYWSSTVVGIKSDYLYIGSGIATTRSGYREDGVSVRCLKDASALKGSINTIDCGSSLFGQAVQYPAGSIFCTAGPTKIVNVTSPLTGKV
ncbi:MAG: hypothetical protein ACOYLO_12770, partial [Ferruginibacter sp.]